MDSQSTYVMEFSGDEARRLELLDHMFASPTQRMLELSGIGPGMKVLDIGTGAGHVAMRVARLVGPTGSVVGVDSDPTILQIARTRAQAADLTNISFLEADLAQLRLDTSFDALVGRMILIHLPSAASILRQLLHSVRPGGIVAFQDTDSNYLGTGFPSFPLFEQTGAWVTETFERAGLSSRSGLKMYQIFLDAGLPAPQINCETPLGGGMEWSGYEFWALSVRSLLPTMLKLGIVTAEEVEIDTLAQRLRDEVVSQRGVVRFADALSAWTRTEV